MGTTALDGVLLVAHGTIEDLDDMPEFLARIRHGRPASPELVAELVRRYQAVGGSPLLELTRAQARELAKLTGLPVLVGMRLWRPTLEEALRGAAHLGLERLCVLPLAPFSVHVYWDAVQRSRNELEQELGAYRPRLLSVPAWGSEPEFVAAQAEHIAPSLKGLPENETELILTAHSLPMRAIQAGDPYASQVEACARAIGERLGCDYRLAYQSQGADGGEWLGPDLQSVLQASRDAGRKRVVVAPFGFLADHIETLYDLDIEAKTWTHALGLEFTRVAALNTDAKFIAALAALVERSCARDPSTNHGRT
jgi:protoporphyrin/coproporphyrin ferrochelatase